MICRTSCLRFLDHYPDSSTRKILGLRSCVYQAKNSKRLGHFPSYFFISILYCRLSYARCFANCSLTSCPYSTVAFDMTQEGFTTNEMVATHPNLCTNRAASRSTTRRARVLRVSHRYPLGMRHARRGVDTLLDQTISFSGMSHCSANQPTRQPSRWTSPNLPNDILWQSPKSPADRSWIATGSAFPKG